MSFFIAGGGALAPSPNPATGAGAAPLRARLRRRLLQGEEVSHRDLETGGQRMDHGQRRVGLTRLDAAHVGPEQAAVRGQLFLFEALSQPQLPDSLPEGALR